MGGEGGRRKRGRTIFSFQTQIGVGEVGRDPGYDTFETGPENAPATPNSTRNSSDFPQRRSLLGRSRMCGELTTCALGGGVTLSPGATPSPQAQDSWVGLGLVLLWSVGRQGCCDGAADWQGRGGSGGQAAGRAGGAISARCARQSLLDLLHCHMWVSRDAIPERVGELSQAAHSARGRAGSGDSCPGPSHPSPVRHVCTRNWDFVGQA